MLRIGLDTRAGISAAIERAGVVAIIRLADASKVPAIVEALVAGGIQALEVTMTVPGALEMIAGLAPGLPDEFVLGVGTVLDAHTAERALDAGARFVVSPVFRRDVIAACHRHDRPAMPGCFTPTEILDAWDAGADFVKVFPATVLGPGFFRDVRAPLPQVKLIPTGGVSVDNAGDWIRAGAVAVGVGSALLDPKAIASGDYAAITAKAQQMLANVRGAREGQP